MTRVLAHHALLCSERSRGLPRWAFPVLGAASCSTFPLEGRPSPDHWGCRFLESPSCWRQSEKQLQQARGWITGPTFRSPQRWKCPRACHQPTAGIEGMIMWVLEQRFMLGRWYYGTDTKEMELVPFSSVTRPGSSRLFWLASHAHTVLYIASKVCSEKTCVKYSVDSALLSGWLRSFI